MRVTAVWDRTADVATWTATGRIGAVAVKSDDSVLVVAASQKGDTVGGDLTKILVKRSTDQGTTFGSSITAIDVTGLGGAAEQPAMVWDPRNNRLHMWSTSTIGLGAGQSWFTNTAPLLHVFSDDNGLTWSAPQQFQSGYNSNWCSGGGEYDATSGRLIIACAGRPGAGLPHSPFALTSTDGVTWTPGPLVDTTQAQDQGEAKFIADGSDWYCLTRTANALPRFLYKSSNLGVSWSQVRSAYPLPDIQCNLGLVNFGGGMWLHSAPMSYPGTFDPNTVDVNTPRRLGMLLKSRDKGRSWSPVARLTSESTNNGTSRQFAYSDLKANAARAYCVYEGENYSRLYLAVLTKTELGG